jgi:hypothetical protein
VCRVEEPVLAESGEEAGEHEEWIPSQ